MKLLFSVITFILLSISVVFSQDDMLDSMSFEPSNIKDETPPYFALAGGYTASFVFIDLKVLNERLANSTIGYGFENDAIKSPIFMPGVQGFTAIGIIPNVRIGFFGMGGSKGIEKDASMGNQKYKIGVDYSVSFQGLSIDYGIILMKSLALVPGISFGWGSTSIESYQSSDSASWSDWPKGLTRNYLNRIENNFAFIQANLNLEYALTPFFMVRGNAGYSLTFSGDWFFNRNAKVNDPPEIKPSGMYFQVGLFLGLFNY